VPAIIENYLDTMGDDRIIDIAFFGGNFTGIQLQRMEEYLVKVYPFVESKKANGIRLSTRPDYIDNSRLRLLKKYGVKTIELGAQSTNDKVLRMSGRGHDASAIQKASGLILEHGFELGLQMMIGLPGDTFETSLQTAKDIVQLGASNTRIYPTLVIKGTALEKLFKDGKYKPMLLDEAVMWTKEIMKVFEENNVTILRIGLHPSEELTEGRSLIAGPFHASFKEMVMTERWCEILSKEIKKNKSKNITVTVNDKQLNYAIGYKSRNKLWINDQNINVKFKPSILLKNYEIQISNN
jgi:histone acetyltransferase (RNA polymerase elongator complex component)